MPAILVEEESPAVTNLAGGRHGEREELLAAVPFGIGVVIDVTGDADNPTCTDSVDCSSWPPWMNIADGTDEPPAGDVLVTHV